MSKFTYLLNDGLAAVERAKEFIGEFVYAPFGIESSSVINGFTLYFILSSVIYVVMRNRRDVRLTMQGRSSNEFGLMRERHR